MLRDVNLIAYLPTFIQDYKEIKNIMNVENPEFQLVVDESEKLKNNQFILSCDEIGIQRYEKLLKIVPNPDDNLGSRISRVLVRWNDSIPYTYRGLIEKLDALCGKGNYLISLRPDIYEFELVVYLSLSGQVDELEYMLSYMIPSNFIVISTNVLDYTAIGTIYAASTNIEVKSFQITSELNVEFLAEGSFLNGSTMTKVLEYTIN